jgi:hypothetical protein
MGKNGLIHALPPVQFLFSEAAIGPVPSTENNTHLQKSVHRMALIKSTG